MDSTTAMARRAGFLYLLFAIVAIVGQFLFPRFLVPGDAAATVRNIAAAEQIYRLGLLVTFVTLIFHLLVVVSLYRLLKPVDPWHAALMVVLVGVGVSLAMANMLHRLVPLVLLNSADALAAIPKAQLDALAFASLRVHGAASAVVLMFWGLWLFPFGILVYRSGFLPRLLGILIIVAGFAYVVTSSTTIALPAYRPAISPFVTPLYVGEVPIIFWLLFFRSRTVSPASEPAFARR